MAGKKGYAAVRRLRERSPKKRAGLPKQELTHDEPSQSMAAALKAYLEWLKIHNRSAYGVKSKGDYIRPFLLWAAERDLIYPQQITRPILESYQRHLWRYRKTNDKPLGISTQRGRLAALKTFFAWLCRQRLLEANPASELELPRGEKRLPMECLSLDEMKVLLNGPDVSDPLGLRDRAILELFYSTGIRRGELVKLEIPDLHSSRKLLCIRQGKGRKDRVVPVGERALYWLDRYLNEVRPLLLLDLQQSALFLSGYGDAFHPDTLSRWVTRSIKEAAPDRRGSCHLLRHTCATHLLEGGADIRYIQQLLGHSSLETTALYTEVSILQLQAVHTRCHPAEQPKSSK